ncbi:hydroxyacylglutathione hydrolase [Buchnera aphidicola (Muscaphis stroyani)]|uniref:Hydroxyacylglutathione hydrolase n=1 Tax=Buchnera aphidicola (Muscaphis stroyani) TaxID=1241869 RepID=A0A4D6Y4P3_9GAMM|nr:hydroxyacylglutathione hydrolase [Buchnera aphidicola]QCI24327.1 hydroxyacylglutathione hydrolase [Buchnera aphidicola (Muscaphis stroyani)]
MKLKEVFILHDNYVWILYDVNHFCIIVDPGESESVINFIEIRKLKPISILLTHNHIDHVKGVKNIIKKYSNVTVYGPYETRKNNVHKIVYAGDKLTLLNRIFTVFLTPGHTLGHVSYYVMPYLFCGDTLFSGGCGRIYKNNYIKMYNSIKIISSFPENTLICCSHEYTLSNLTFSMLILSNDIKIKRYYNKMLKRTKKNKKTIPSFLKEEKVINLFLKTHEETVKKSVGLSKENSSFETFVRLRLIKNLLN